MTDQLPFIDKRLRMGWKEGIGLGVFADEEIEKHTFVEIAPVVVCSNSSISQDKEAFKYVLAWNEGLAIPLGWTMMYNHSDNNNCEFSSNIQQRLLAICTLKKINKGDQLTVNYGPNWFSSRGIEKTLI